MDLDPVSYYNPEIYLFPAVQRRFQECGVISGEALYIILDWKSPRARTRHLKRLTQDRTLDEAAGLIARDLRDANSEEGRLAVLIERWGFRLPTASALLTVLYPDIFSVYDVRVCNILGNFQGLDGRAWNSNVWEDYQRYVAAVRHEAPAGLSLRDCDRYLWGADKRNTLLKEIASRP